MHKTIRYNGSISFLCNNCSRWRYTISGSELLLYGEMYQMYQSSVLLFFLFFLLINSSLYSAFHEAYITNIRQLQYIHDRKSMKVINKYQYFQFSSCDIISSVSNLENSIFVFTRCMSLDNCFHNLLPLTSGLFLYISLLMRSSLKSIHWLLLKIILPRCSAKALDHTSYLVGVFYVYSQVLIDLILHVTHFHPYLWFSYLYTDKLFLYHEIEELVVYLHVS